MSDLTRLEELLAGLQQPRVLIVGDVIMDRYVMGDVSRISPEAPIPVLGARTAELRLGGAGNVAANLRAMGAEVSVVGVVGNDGLGRAMREEFEKEGVECEGLVIDPTRPTIEKTRMISGVQQMLRVDWEDTRPLDGAALEQVLAGLERALASAQAVILSDYGKGVLIPQIIERCVAVGRERGLPVLVDPKGSDYSRYHGATLVTPNKKEAEEALGRRIADHSQLPAAADELIERAGLDSILITLGADGIYYRTRDGEDGRDPAQARAVFDVVGAGDTVVGHLALYLGAGLELPDAVALANLAAGIVVGRLGTNSVTREELAARLEETQRHTGKVLQPGDLDNVIETWRREGRRIVFTNGCFDILHAGHVDYLRFSASKGDRLIVGMNDDASVSRLKGPERPVNCLEDRMVVLAALEMVDGVVAFGEDTPLDLIERITPDVLVKGEDWADKGVVGREWVEKHGGQVALAPLVPGRSTTNILERTRGGGSSDGGDAS